MRDNQFIPERSGPFVSTGSTLFVLTSNPPFVSTGNMPFVTMGSTPFIPTRNVRFVPAHTNRLYPMENGRGPPMYHQALLDHQQLRRVQFAASNILIEAFASGNLPSMNDETLRRHAEYDLGWRTNSLDSEHARLVVFQTRCMVLTHLEEAALSATIRFAVLGVALGPSFSCLSF
ncbi:hypothetical protein PLEOSDRAFT_1086016 [Pleurotus ostreatus PC15]|uniref:Uncharacterized protein n=1 Tax=Pleurotus ostreatus (strain PC15) TaxID=1137138 RepID=A0A067NN49_PLEO1|nr:hypothetical protein PLEOSDRAFT_1086016 [Pleurotus ostreatus PC15]